MTFRTTMTRAMATQSFKLKKNSPHILFGAGLVGMAASTVLACRATLKLEPVLDDIKEELEMVADANAVPVAGTRDVAYAYGKSCARLGRLYGPAIGVGALSVAALTGSHIQLTRRNTALTVAYAGLHTAYLEYRERVRAEVGEEKERDIYQGITYEKSKDLKGKLVNLQTVDPNKLSVYAVIFDEFNVNWMKDAELNKIFIKCQENYANQRLHARGYLFLNEVLDTLGFPPTKAGQHVGWIINSDGDNFVDFGMFEAHQSGFVNGFEPSIILDFNVDGVIIDKVLD